MPEPPPGPVKRRILGVFEPQNGTMRINAFGKDWNDHGNWPHGKIVMAYVRLKGIPGLVYVPDQPEDLKKHDCSDCFCCQWCSDGRCRACLKQGKCKKTRRTCRRTEEDSL